MNGEIETLYERNLRIAIADAVKKDRGEVLTIVMDLNTKFEPWLAMVKTLQMLKERAK